MGFTALDEVLEMKLKPAKVVGTKAELTVLGCDLVETCTGAEDVSVGKLGVNANVVVLASSARFNG